MSYEEPSWEPEWLTENFDDMLEQDCGLSSIKVCGWGLGHCQGDGVAFAGNISASDIQAIRDLAKEIKGEKTDERRKDWLRKFLPDYIISDKQDSLLELDDRLRKLVPDDNYGWCITVKNDGRYYHWNSMDARFGDSNSLYDHLWDMERHQDQFTRAVAEVLRDQIEEITGAMESAVDQWMKDLSRHMEDVGYEWIGAMNKEDEERRAEEAEKAEDDENETAEVESDTLVSAPR